MPDTKEYNVLLAGDLTFKEWQELTNACRQDKVSTLSSVEHNCPNCGTKVRAKWFVYVREVDKDLTE